MPVPERVFLVPPLIPANNVALLYGDGGLGKSLLGLGLAAARAARREWLGLNTLPGRTLVLSAEDDLDELHRRLSDYCRHYKVSIGDLSDIRLLDLVGQDAVIGELARNGRIVATELYHFMMREIAKFTPGLVIVDALADSFAGDENNRTQARQFSARMYLETLVVDGKEPDPNIKVLRQPKANYAAGGFELVLHYEAGVLVPMATGAPLSEMAKQAQAENVFMIILTRLFEQGRFVGQSKGINFAPAIFAREPEAADAMVSKDRLHAAMIKLFEKKRIIIQPYGEKARGKTRIEEAPL